jgi:hemerythrin superfamily protein
MTMTVGDADIVPNDPGGTAMSTISPTPVRRAKRRVDEPTSTLDAIVMLRDDHKRVSALFRAYGRDRDDLSTAEKASLVARICHELLVHATIEKEIFYPAAREALGFGGGDLLDKADVEHETVNDLIRQLLDVSPETSHYDAKVKVLAEYVRHHVGEEHDEMFPRCRKAGMDLGALGLAMAERRAELDRRN